MKYLNDLTPPVIVLTGFLNPAIFSPPWIASHIQGYPSGSVLNLHQAFYTAGGEMRQLVLLDGVGWSVTNNRCEIFVTSLEETFLKRAEDFACKVVETLPHTPWGSVGVNLQFLALDDATDIVDRYTTVENFEAEFQVGNQAQSTEILISPAVTLNVQRNIEDQFSVYFNHHYHSVDPLTVREKLQGSISQALERCRAVMSKFYQMTEEQVKVLDPQVGEVSSGQ